ncbi:uncharacterized protein LOC129794310 [Lutzomyia longipalpis]|uniref:uncharacterized protein LOC129794310 n=1 Tax=Lutzomyia longipalpis TaxID=7200 RepID=UPI002484617E|nr:uncharacterized protein LOC129794310 [Lutzomyia longipalpis]
MSGASHALTFCGVEHLLYADDLIIFASSRDSGARTEIRRAIKCLEKWSKDFGFKFSAQKTKAIHFCRHQPCLAPPSFTIYDSPIAVEETIKILGVNFDNKLSFKQHVANLRSECAKRVQLIRTLANTSWGADRSQLLQVSLAVVGGKCDYGVQAYGTASISTLNRLNGPYNAAIRLSTGAFKSSPVESVLAEAGVSGLEERRSLLIMRWANKVKSDPTHLLHKAITSRKPMRSRRITSIVDHFLNWAREYKLPQATFIRRSFPVNPPWQFSEHSVDTSFSVHKKKDTHPLEFLGMVLERLESLESTQEVRVFYTDGSKQADGTGFGMYRVSPELKIAKKLRKEASIFSAEASAILFALRFDPADVSHRVIFTDSLSVCSAVLGFDSRASLVVNIRDLLIKNPQFRIVWIPGHCGIPGNEVADELANSSINRYLLDDPRVSLEDSQHQTRVAWQKRKSEAWTSLSSDNKFRNICSDPSALARPVGLDRREQCILTRLRIGHTRVTHGYLMEGLTRPPKCDVCVGNKTVTVQHILEECIKFSSPRNALGGIGVSMIGDGGDESGIKRVLNFIEKCGLQSDI